MQGDSKILWAGLFLAVAASGLAAQESSSLSLKAYKNFNFVMPQDVWVKIAHELPLQHPNGTGFRAVRDGLKLEVDTNGDGRPDDEVKGASGFLVFRSSEGDRDFRYAARFRGGKAGFEFACSGAMTGKVDGIPLLVFDLNCNGIYGEVGKDALIVGRNKAASYLSNVISYKDKLYTLEVSADGGTATVTPFEGETGTISIAKSFSAHGRLDAAVIQDEKGNSFELADERSGLTVPVGQYKLVSGFVSKGSSTARIRAGSMKPIVVEAGQTTTFEWGAPVVAQISYTFDGSEVKVGPTQVKFFGKAGEEYFDFYPDAKSPKFTVLEAESEQEVGGFQYVGC